MIIKFLILLVGTLPVIFVAGSYGVDLSREVTTTDEWEAIEFDLSQTISHATVLAFWYNNTVNSNVATTLKSAWGKGIQSTK